MSSIPPIPSSQITPESVYLSRRQLMRGAGSMAASALVLAACGSGSPTEPAIAPGPSAPGGADSPEPVAGRSPGAPPSSSAQGAAAEAGAPAASASSDELGDPLTDFEAVTGYNNFYEFSTEKEAVAGLAADFPVEPWAVRVGGLVERPRTFAVEDLERLFPPEERVYRLRCVEGWSMVIPWLGFPLARLLAEVGPTGQAKYVRFETIMDPEHMPGQRRGPYRWPYVEGLRLDEAMHALTLLATGLYGRSLLPQNGAPLRLVVPWKYGFKSIKSIVKIDLVESQPESLWMAAAPDEYGFYANVNPDVPHPRWSQSSERRIGELRRRRTLPFNGYAEQVAGLYAGMDLEANF